MLIIKNLSVGKHVCVCVCVGIMIIVLKNRMKMPGVTGILKLCCEMMKFLLIMLPQLFFLSSVLKFPSKLLLFIKKFIKGVNYLKTVHTPGCLFSTEQF